MNFQKFFIVLALLTTPPLYGMKRSALFTRQRASTLLSPGTFRISALSRPLHYDHLKHLYNGLTDEAKPYSPVHAAALAESGWIKGLYEHGNKEDSTVKLLNDEKTGLFYLKTNQFRPTQNKSNPSYSLNAPLIGTIIGVLKTKKFDTSNVRADIIKQWRTEHTKVAGNPISTAKIEKILDTINASFLECNESDSIYLPHTTESLLLGFLYRKATIKEEMITYLESLNRHVHVFTHENYRDQLVIDYYTSDEEKKYEYVLNSASGNKQIEGLLDTHYEQGVHRSIENIFRQPPQVIQGSHTFDNDMVSRPDCFETSIRGIINRLLVNKKDRFFDLSLLPQSLKPRAELTKFYTNYAAFDTVNGSKNQELVSTGKAWLHLVSNIPLIDYRRGNWEIRSSTQNMIRLFNYLFNSKATSLEELGSVLSDSRRSIIFKAAKDIVLYDDNNVITITITEGSHSEQIFLHITSCHTWLSRSNQNTMYNGNSTFCFTSAFLSQDINPDLTKQMIQNLSCFTALQSTKVNKPSASSRKALYHYYLSRSLGDPHEAYTICKEIITNSFLRENPSEKSRSLVTLAFELMKRLPDDAYYARGLGEMIIKQKLYMLDQRFEEYLKNTPYALASGLQHVSDENEINKLITWFPENYVSSYYHLSRITYGKNELVDAFIFKSLLPLKKDYAFCLTAQEQEQLLIKIFPQYSGYLSHVTLDHRIHRGLVDLLPQGTPQNLLAYTFHKDKLSEFIQLLEVGADPDRIVRTILSQATIDHYSANQVFFETKTDQQKKALIFLKHLLKFKPKIFVGDLYYLKYCFKECLKLFLDAGYNQDTEFVTTIFQTEDTKKIALLCSYGIDKDLQQQFLYDHYKKLYNTLGWDLGKLIQRRTIRKIIAILENHDAVVTQEQQEELNELKKNGNYSWLQTIL